MIDIEERIITAKNEMYFAAKWKEDWAVYRWMAVLMYWLDAKEKIKIANIAIVMRKTNTMIDYALNNIEMFED